MLRALEEKDVSRMLDWMHDFDVNKFYKNNFSEMTEENVKEFISSNNPCNKNFAFVDEDDNYLGTVSLKNINLVDKNAEYAIVTRKDAQGTGAAYAATLEILEYAFKKLKLHKVYLNVLGDNLRAKLFYKKVGFILEGCFNEHILIYGEYKNLEWYGMTYEEYKGKY